MNVLRWSQPVAYFRPLGARVPVSIADHNDLIRGEAIPAAFARRYGKAVPFSAQQQLVLSDRWHLARSIADDIALWTARSQRGAITMQMTGSGSPLDFSTTNTFSANPTNADFLWVFAGNDRSGSGTTVNSITWNSLSFTLQTGITSPIPSAGRMGHLVGTLNGAQNIVITNSSTNTKPMAMVTSYAGVDQTTPVTNVTTLSNTATDAATWSVAGGVSGDWLAASAITNSGSLTYTAGTNTNTRTSRDFSGVGSGVIGDEVVSTDPQTINWTHSSTSQWGYAFVLKVVAAAGATLTPTVGGLVLASVAGGVPTGTVLMVNTARREGT